MKWSWPALLLLLLPALPLPLQAGPEEIEAEARQLEAQAAARADQVLGELRALVQELELKNQEQIQQASEQVHALAEEAKQQAADIETRTRAAVQAVTDPERTEGADLYDSEEAQKKAEAALLRTGPTGPDIRPLVPTITDIVIVKTDIVALSKAVQGKDNALAARVIGLDQAISDLGAKVTPMAIVVNLQSDVLFDFDKAEIKPAAQQALTKVALVIKNKGTGKVVIEGHTDAKGSEAYNQQLSERRATAVKNWLVRHGSIAPDRLVTKGYGETRPVAPNTHPDGTDNPEGRAKNRRVEITIATVQENG